MATDDHSKSDADSIPTTPLGADPLVPQATAVAPAPTPPDRPGFFRRTWVWVTAAALAVLILLGGGIGVGYALSGGPDDSDGPSFGHPGREDGDMDGRRGPQGHEDDGDGDGDGGHHARGNPDDDGNSQERPTPAPSDTGTTNP